MAAKPPPKGAQTKLYEHMAYPDAPFGPYEKPEAVSRNNTQTFLPGGGTARVNREADKGHFSLAARIDTSEFSWGQLVITAEATGMNFDAGSMGGDFLLPQRFPHVEVRVLAFTGMVSFVWFEGALGHHGLVRSAGPVFLPFTIGEVPDILEVYAEMLGGNFSAVLPRTAGFTVNVASRFHR